MRHHRVSFPSGVGGPLGLKPPKGFGLSCGVARGNECRGQRMVGSVAGQWHLGGLSEALSVQASWNVFWERRDRSGCFWDVGVLPFFLFPGRGGEPFSFFFFLSLSLSLSPSPSSFFAYLFAVCLRVCLSLSFSPAPFKYYGACGNLAASGDGDTASAATPAVPRHLGGVRSPNPSSGIEFSRKPSQSSRRNGETLEVAGKAFMRI